VQPIRVGHVIPDLATGGAETSLVRLLEGLDRARFASLVVTLRDGGALTERAQLAGAHVVSLGMRSRLPSPFTIARLRARLRAFAPDVLQGWMYHGNLAASLGVRLVPERPALVWNIRQSMASLAHQRAATRPVIRVNAMLSRRADRIVNNSVTSARQHAALGFDASRVEIIPNGFDTERFRPSAAVRRAVRSELGLAPGALLVGMIARFDRVKRHDLFVAAVAHAVRGGLDVHALLAGIGMTAANPDVARLVSRAGVDGRVHLLGERTDVDRLMPALDVLVSASGWAEGFPNVVGEAMASGVPCLVTDTGDCAAIVGDGGVVVPAGDAGALRDALDALLRSPPARRSALGQAGRERVAAEFSLARCVARYATLYEELARSRSRPRLASSGATGGVGAPDREDRERTPSSTGNP
jgi:glycosyltransferase involved in cell wall biosynthesis